MSNESSPQHNNKLDKTCFSERPNNNSTFLNYHHKYNEGELNNETTNLASKKNNAKNINFLTNLLVKPINGHQNTEISDHYNLDISSFAQYTPPTSQTGLSILATSKLLNSTKSKNNSVSSDSSSSLSPTTLSEQSQTTSPVASSPNSCTPVNTSPKNNTEISKNLIFSPILESPDSNQQRSEIVYTPDSLESSNSTSSSLSNLLDEETASKSYNSNNSAKKSKPLEIEDDLEADEEIRQINDHNKPKNEQLNDTSLILEKIKKINQLQEKINDINNKIKSIDMTSNTVIGETTKVNSTSPSPAINKNYYILQQSLSDSDSPDLAESPPLKENDSLQYYINPNYCDEDEDDEIKIKEENVLFEDDAEDEDVYNNDRITYQNNLNRFNKCVDRNSEDYRSQNNQTRFGVRQKTVEEKNNEIFENITYVLIIL